MNSPWTSLEIAKFAASLAGPIVTIVGFWFILQQLRNTNRQIEIAGDGLEASNRQNKTNQDWKRAEFVASEFKEFYGDPVIIKVLRMIDYYDRRYDIGMKDDDDKPCLTRIVHSKSAELKLRERDSSEKHSLVSIEAALGPSDEYTDEETTIRDYFDMFLYYIERFESFLKAGGLITEEEIFPYLRYTIRIFRGKLAHVDPAMLEAFRAYLREFHFEDAKCFFYKRFIVLD
jgi:hypothetical protein